MGEKPRKSRSERVQKHALRIFDATLELLSHEELLGFNDIERTRLVKAAWDMAEAFQQEIDRRNQ